MTHNIMDPASWRHWGAFERVHGRESGKPHGCLGRKITYLTVDSFGVPCITAAGPAFDAAGEKDGRKASSCPTCYMHPLLEFYWETPP